MPTKVKGMTSLEIAIIVAIVLVIAIAVGWYLYTTFAAAGQQSGLVVTSAKAYASNGTLLLSVVPQGAAQVVIVGIDFAGTSISTTITVGSATTVTVKTNLQLQAGQVLTGRVILSNGATAPFTATVVPSCQTTTTK